MTHDKMLADTRQVAVDMERSAHGMMRASFGALRDGDVAGAAREQCIASREYEWTARLWRGLCDPGEERRCLDLAQAVRSCVWVDPETP